MSAQTMVLLILLAISIVLPMIINFGFQLSGKKMKTVLGINVALFFSILAAVTVMLFTGTAFAEGAAADGSVQSWGFLSAALVTGLSCIGAGIAVAAASSSALGALSEDPAIMGKALIFVALAEGIALYGLLVAFSILGRLG